MSTVEVDVVEHTEKRSEDTEQGHESMVVSAECTPGRQPVTSSQPVHCAGPPILLTPHRPALPADIDTDTAVTMTTSDAAIRDDGLCKQVVEVTQVKGVLT